MREKGKASREWKRVKTGGGGDGRRSIFQVHVSQPHLIYPLFPSLFLRPSLSLFAFIFPDSDPFLLPPLARPSFLPLLPSPPFLPSFSASSSVLLLHHRIHPASPFSDSTTLHNHHPRKPFELSNPLWISPYATYHGFRMFSVRGICKHR